MDKPDHLLSREELHEAVRKQRQKLHRQQEEEAKKHVRPRWLLPEGPTSEPQLAAKAPIQLPEEPIHHCEVDEATGEYYCPFCSYEENPVAEDPWEAMFHEVAHFEPEEAAEMREQHARNIAEQERQQAHPPKGQSRRQMEPDEANLDAASLPPKRAFRNKRRVVLAIGAALMVLAGLYPPWRAVMHGPAGISTSRYVGHHFSPPATRGWQGIPDSGQVDFRYLLLEWAVIALGAAGAAILMQHAGD